MSHWLEYRYESGVFCRTVYKLYIEIKINVTNNFDPFICRHSRTTIHNCTSSPSTRNRMLGLNEHQGKRKDLVIYITIFVSVHVTCERERVRGWVGVGTCDYSVHERERETERQRWNRQAGRQAGRQRQRVRQADRETQRETERERLSLNLQYSKISVFAGGSVWLSVHICLSGYLCLCSTLISKKTFHSYFWYSSPPLPPPPPHPQSNPNPIPFKGFNSIYRLHTDLTPTYSNFGWIKQHQSKKSQNYKTDG